ncbi:MAG: tRNA uridine(34) 5-carboxymethylaminomethyl modification radical SAM/GNAT enzyme Elp3 [Candidatus Kariarchaeaceae archaeon]|jgi:elongator complex protein 3
MESGFSKEVPKNFTKDEVEAFLAIIERIREERPDKTKLEQIKRSIAKKYQLNAYPRNSDILKYTSADVYEEVVPFLRTRTVRSLSGVNVISVFTAPFNCKHGACIYCPGGPTWGTPMSYTGREPGAMRAIANGFDPTSQIMARIDQLQAMGHNAEKLDVIVMGGTFNSTLRKYQDQFMLGVYAGMNGCSAETIEEAKKQNETAKHRCIGLTFETKPDWAKKKHIKQMLEYGVTRVEIGVQTLQNDVLQLVNRGHSLQDTIDSFKAMRDAGLKITVHMMPGLPGTTPEIDIEDFKTLYNDPRYIPDEIKIYPTQVIENTPLAQMVLDGEYQGLSNEQTFEIMKKAKLLTPPFVRIKRALRDLPIPLVVAGPTWGDMRARIQKQMSEIESINCRCIRCREIGLNLYKKPEDFEILEFKEIIRSYDASDGVEYFISYEDKNELLVGFLRLRFPSDEVFINELLDAAIVRELHVYGSSLPILTENLTTKEGESFQHKGYGKKLLKKAETMAKNAGYTKLAIISGVGVREYYRKFGYELEGVYMVKKL